MAGWIAVGALSTAVVIILSFWLSVIVGNGDRPNRTDRV